MTSPFSPALSLFRTPLVVPIEKRSVCPVAWVNSSPNSLSGSAMEPVANTVNSAAWAGKARSGVMSASAAIEVFHMSLFLIVATHMLKQVWSYRLEYFCSACREYEWAGRKTFSSPLRTS